MQHILQPTSSSSVSRLPMLLSFCLTAVPFSLRYRNGTTAVSVCHFNSVALLPVLMACRIFPCISARRNVCHILFISSISTQTVCHKWDVKRAQRVGRPAVARAACACGTQRRLHTSSFVLGETPAENKGPFYWRLSEARDLTSHTTSYSFFAFGVVFVDQNFRPEQVL